MRIEFIYGPFSTGSKEFNFEHLFDDPAGLTGSEISCFMLAREMAALGHEVYLYTRLMTGLQHPYKWEGVEIRRTGILASERPVPDVVYSWNEPDLLKYFNQTVLKMVNQQLNDFNYCNENKWDDFVDIYTSPSQSHLEYISQFTPNKNKWIVIPNGYDPALINLNCQRIPGRVIYASSPDRGLHLLLQAWPKIKNAVPEASLKIFYNFMPWFYSSINILNDAHVSLRETRARAQYIYYALNRMRHGYGITHHKSISKNQLAREMCRATVLGYPCSTIRPTEGFSVSILEACASGMFPVISSEDSLGQIYGSVVPMVDTPVSKHLDEFANLVIKGLTDNDFRKAVVDKTVEFAKDFTWTKIAKNLEQIMQNGVQRKKNG